MSGGEDQKDEKEAAPNSKRTLRNRKLSIVPHIDFAHFCRVHHTLGKTPAMAAGLTDHAWTVEELLTGSL